MCVCECVHVCVCVSESSSPCTLLARVVPIRGWGGGARVVVVVVGQGGNSAQQIREGGVAFALFTVGEDWFRG